MRKLWGRKNSSNVMKVIWLLEELQLPYERIDVGGPFGRTHDPDYLAMNPNSVVPTLEEENGFTLWESNAILRYLASSHASGWPTPRRRTSGRRTCRPAPTSTAGWTGSRPPDAARLASCSRAWSARPRSSAMRRRSRRG